MSSKETKSKPVSIRTDLYLVLAGRKAAPHRRRQEKRQQQKLRRLLTEG